MTWITSVPLLEAIAPELQTHRGGREGRRARQGPSGPRLRPPGRAGLPRTAAWRRSSAAQRGRLTSLPGPQYPTIPRRRPRAGAARAPRRPTQPRGAERRRPRMRTRASLAPPGKARERRLRSRVESVAPPPRTRTGCSGARGTHRTRAEGDGAGGCEALGLVFVRRGGSEGFGGAAEPHASSVRPPRSAPSLTGRAGPVLAVLNEQPPRRCRGSGAAHCRPPAGCAGRFRPTRVGGSAVCAHCRQCTECCGAMSDTQLHGEWLRVSQLFPKVCKGAPLIVIASNSGSWLFPFVATMAEPAGSSFAPAHRFSSRRDKLNLTQTFGALGNTQWESSAFPCAILPRDANELRSSG